MMTQAISDFPPLKRCSAPHPLEADEDNLSLRPALPLKGKFAHLFFIPLGFLCKILQAGSRVPVIRDGVWQRLSRCNSRAVKHNVTQAALENCLCAPLHPHGTAATAGKAATSHCKELPLSKGIPPFPWLLPHFPHAMKAHSWESVRRGTCYTYSILRTSFFPSRKVFLKRIVGAGTGRLPCTALPKRPQLVFCPGC